MAFLFGCGQDAVEVEESTGKTREEPGNFMSKPSKPNLSKVLDDSVLLKNHQSDSWKRRSPETLEPNVSLRTYNPDGRLNIPHLGNRAALGSLLNSKPSSYGQNLGSSGNTQMDHLEETGKGRNPLHQRISSRYESEYLQEPIQPQSGMGPHTQFLRELRLRKAAPYTTLPEKSNFPQSTHQPVDHRPYGSNSQNFGQSRIVAALSQSLEFPPSQRTLMLNGPNLNGEDTVHSDTLPSNLIDKSLKRSAFAEYYVRQPVHVRPRRLPASSVLSTTTPVNGGYSRSLNNSDAGGQIWGRNDFADATPTVPRVIILPQSMPVGRRIPEIVEKVGFMFQPYQTNSTEHQLDAGYPLTRPSSPTPDEVLRGATSLPAFNMGSSMILTSPSTPSVAKMVVSIPFGHDNPDTRIPSRTMRFVDKPERESAVQSASKRSGSSTQSRAGSLVNMSSPIPNHLEKTQEHTSAEAHPFARGSIEIGSPNYWAQKNNKEGLMTMSYMSTPKSSENHWQPFSPEQQPAYKPITNRLIRGKPAAPVHQQPNKETNGSSPRNPDKQRPVIRLATNQVEEYFKTSNPVRSNLQALFRDSVTGPLKHTAPVGGGRHV